MLDFGIGLYVVVVVALMGVIVFQYFTENDEDE
jgi:hypothetical protein